MPLIEWNEGLFVGAEVIDKEHQKWVSLINALAQALERGAGREEVEHVLDGAIAYTLFHFRHEEQLFSQTDYPDIAFHKSIHENLAGKIMALHEKFMAGQEAAVSQELMWFLKEWLISHIQGIDRTYVPYLKAKGLA